MTTVLVWLLISMGNTDSHTARPTMVIERFATREDCIKVMEFLNGKPDRYSSRNMHTCVDANIAVLP